MGVCRARLTAGHERIRMTGEQMRIAGNVWRGAQRFFTLAVDAKFNKGRRSEYVVASCLYLQCRYTNSDKMLIDFSERLAVGLTTAFRCARLTFRSTCSS